MDVPAPNPHAVETDANPDRVSDRDDQVDRTVEVIPGPALSADERGRVDAVNQHWSQLTGLGPEAAFGHGWYDAAHQDDDERLREFWQARVRSGEPGTCEVRLRRGDGHVRRYLLRAVPQLDRDGRPSRWFGQFDDVEERRQAELLLAGEKQLLEMVASAHPLPEILDTLCRLAEESAPGCLCSIVLIAADGHHIEHAAAPSLPVTFTAAIDGRAIGEDCGPCGMATHLNLQIVATDLARETRWQDSQWCTLALRHDLRACWSTPIRSSAGRVLGAFAIYFTEPAAPSQVHQGLIGRFTHIAGIAIEGASREAALRRSESFLAEAQRLSLTGSFLWRINPPQILWSEQTYRIYGLDPAVPVTFELVGTRIHPDEAAWFAALVDTASRQGDDLEFEHRLVMPDGSVKFLHVVAHALHSETGHIEYLGAVQDVTERRRADAVLGRLRAELTHVSRMTTLGALSASIAHEVSQPLAGIVTNAGLLLRILGDEVPDLDSTRESAQRIIRDAHRASEVVDRLRALFRRAAPSSETVDLNDATTEVLAIVAPELQHTGTTMRTDLGVDMPPVRGDRVQLQQVIMNLLLNAIEAMGTLEGRPRAAIIRSGHDAARRVWLSVEDSGPGFDPAHADRLFNTFFTTKPGGMGVGLYVSRTIIESHGGRLTASTHSGGATFTLSLPAESNHPPPNLPPKGQA